MVYNTNTKQFQYCDGTDWIAMHPPGSGSGGCANPSRDEGQITYNPTYGVMQGCAGNQWRRMGPPGTKAPTNGLVGYWTFDEGSGTTAADSSGNGNDLTVSGASPWTTGIVNGAFYFNGASEGAQVSNPSNDLWISGSFSFSMWLRFGSIPSSMENIFYINSTNHYQSLEVTQGTPDYVKFNVNSGQSGAANDTNTDYQTGTWYQVTGVYDDAANTMAVYVNGEEAVSKTENCGPCDYPDPVSSLEMGFGTGFAATVDDFRIYNRALSTTEVQDIYDSTRGGGDYASGLVGWWKMDEASGNITDDSGNGYTGTVTGSPTYSVPAKDGTGIRFTADSQNFNMGNVLGMTDSFTVAMWLNSDNIGGANNDMFDKANNYGVQFLPSGDLSCWLYSGGSFYEHGYSALSTGVWYHVACVFDNAANTMKIYVNGAQVYSGTETHTPAASSYDFTIGMASWDGEYYRGVLDDVRVYDRALSATDIAALYAGLSGRFCTSPIGAEGAMMFNGAATGPTSGLVGHWKFDESAGTSAADDTGAGNTGTLHNFPASPWAPTTGQINGALTFDNTDSYVDAANESNFDFERTDPFSLSLWVYRNNQSSEDELITKYEQPGGLYRGYGMWLDSGSGRLHFTVVNGGANAAEVHTTSSSAVSTGAWHHIVATYDGSSNISGMKIYVDDTSLGLTVDNNNLDQTVLNNSKVVIGADAADTTCCVFNGKIDDVRIYNRELSPSEVSDLYNAAGTPLNIMQYCNGSEWVAIGKAPPPFYCAGAGGVDLGGACWFLGAIGESCDTVCGNAGLSYDAAGQGYADDPNATECEAVLDALGAVGTGAPSSSSCSYGCSARPSNSSRRLCTSTTSSSSSASRTRACACQ